jgi:serine/threonine protein kinase
MKIIINPEYKRLTSFIEAIPSLFDKKGEVIYKERNEIKVFDAGEEKIIVKSFKIPHFFNKIIYSCLRSSKAERSYKYALKLIEKEINTSMPVAYLEEKQTGLLTSSYYVSIYKEYPGMLRELRYSPLTEKKELACAFARFTADIHQKGVFPLDYSPGNILYQKIGDEYNFCLIDINRMRFVPVDLALGAYGFRRLWGNEETLSFIAKEYAKLRNFDEEKFEYLALKHHRIFWKKYSKRHGGFSPYIGDNND